MPLFILCEFHAMGFDHIISPPSLPISSPSHYLPNTSLPLQTQYDWLFLGAALVLECGYSIASSRSNQMSIVSQLGMGLHAHLHSSILGFCLVCVCGLVPFCVLKILLS